MERSYITKLSLIFCLAVLWFPSYATAWSVVNTEDGMPLMGIMSISSHERGFVVSTADDIYFSGDGKNFTRLSGQGTLYRITATHVDQEHIYAASARGIMVYDGKTWREFSRLRGVTGLSGTGVSGSLFAWDQRRVYIIEDGSYESITPGTRGNVVGAVFWGDEIYSLWEDSLRSVGEGFSRGRILSGPGGESAITEGDEEDYDDAVERYVSVSAGKGSMAVASGRAVYLRNERNWENVPLIGLSGEIAEVVITPNEELLALTSRGVFVYRRVERSWDRITPLMRDLDIFRARSFGDNIDILAAGRNRLFFCRAVSKNNSSSFQASPETHHVHPRQAPPIRMVQEMAIEHAEVSPEKVASWRESAATQALLPRLSLRFRCTDSDNSRIYTSATTNYIIQGPRRIGYDYTVGLDWDFSQLIWNRDQTTIDTRSRLTVKLRMEVLEEVNRLYYERERLVERIKSTGPEDAPETGMMELKLRELEAHLDGFTGGGFSENML